MPSLIGTKSNQVPTVGDLGTLAFQDANAVNITGGAISGNIVSTGINIDSNTLVVDATNDRVGIGIASPSFPLTVNSSSAQIAIQNSTTGTGASDGSRFQLLGSDLAIVNREAASIQFYTSDTERIRIPADAGGITFPATQVASADANTLDDYEEGTWTPILNGSGSTPTVTYSNRYGSYTRIGRMVYISFRIQVATISGGSGSLQVGGLPYQSASDFQQNLGGTFASGLAWGASATQLSPWVVASAQIVQFRGLINNAGNVDTEITGVSNGDYIDAQGWYFV
jgi:hypothetical protein